MDNAKIMFFLLELVKILKNIKLDSKVRAKIFAIIQIISDEVTKHDLSEMS
jgi:hypothetical protein